MLRSDSAGAVSGSGDGRDFGADVEFLGQQSRGHAAHEQQSVNGALIACEHRVPATGGNGPAVLDAASAMFAQSVKQRERFVGGSVPAYTSSHGKADLR